MAKIYFKKEKKSNKKTKHRFHLSMSSTELFDFEKNKKKEKSRFHIQYLISFLVYIRNTYNIHV